MSLEAPRHDRDDAEDDDHVEDVARHGQLGKLLGLEPVKELKKYSMWGERGNFVLRSGEFFGFVN